MKKKASAKQNQSDMELLYKAQEVLETEARAVGALAERIDKRFLHAIELILNCSGRIVVTGMGKSGHIGRKLAATLASTGTPALFLHPAEGVHGDLGAVVQGDVMLALSYGGDTEELSAIIPGIKRLGVPIIALCGRPDSELGRRAEVLLDISVDREACPFNLAPTASTTAMLAMGDALAVALMHARRFSQEDYQKLHPAGRLGRQMLLRVEDIMRTGDSFATVGLDMPIQEVLFAIASAHAGAASVLDKTGKLAGIIADGDIRRHLLTHPNGLKDSAQQAMTKHPKTAQPEQLATEVLLVMEKHQIGEMPVLDESGKPVGVLNLKDLLRAGIV